MSNTRAALLFIYLYKKFDVDEEIELLVDFTSPTTGKTFYTRQKGVVQHSYFSPLKVQHRLLEFNSLGR